MKKTLIVVISLAMLVSLAACKKAAEAPATSAGTMANMPVASEMKHGTGVGMVVTLDAETGTISIEHGPIKELGWPGMTMGFTAKPDLLKGLAKGDQVRFEIDWDGKEGAVTSIHKSQ